MSELQPDQIVDARNHPCPMPILMLKRALKNMATDQMILVKSTDPHSQQDLIHFCQIQSLEIVHMDLLSDEFHYYIRN